MKNEELEIWKTGISQAFWCHMNELDANRAYEPAFELIKRRIEGIEQDVKIPICWFDKLFRGGIKVPDTSERPLTFLFTGPPGTGKSYLALELCYMLAKNEIYIDPHTRQNLNPLPKNSIYISTESTSSQILQRAKEFKWNQKDVLLQYSKNVTGAIKDKVLSNGKVIIFDSEQLNKGENILRMVSRSLKIAFPYFKIIAKNIPLQPEIKIPANIGVEASSELLDKQDKDEEKKKDGVPHSLRFFKNRVQDIGAQVMIIDSLNSIPKEKQKEKIFNKFLKILSGKIKVVIFILDSAPNSSEHKFWEYLCDNVIHFDSCTLDDYWLRTIEIKKARFQEHVQGKQVIKICSSFNEKEKDFASKMAPRYSHPYRNDGGLFIYPSIHYYLSRYKRIPSKELNDKQGYAESYPEGLNSLVSNKTGLIPEGRCTAFLGQRGGHKSHLGYLHLLNRMLKFKESAIVVSLRDDEEMTRQTMCNILAQEPELKVYARKFILENNCEEEAKIIKWLEDKGRLEILYYHPGYITPEEFTHRMIMSVRHIKHDGLVMKEQNGPDFHWEKLNLMFNSLDQLSSRFPLCAKQGIFVPGLIDSLNGEKVTSIFVAVEMPDQPLSQYGLLPMADLVLTFNTQEFGCEEFLNYIKKYMGISENNSDLKDLVKKFQEKKHTTITVNVSRFAGGEMAGAKGILELITKEGNWVHPLVKKRGLHFIPFG